MTFHFRWFQRFVTKFYKPPLGESQGHGIPGYVDIQIDEIETFPYLCQGHKTYDQVLLAMAAWHLQNTVSKPLPGHFGQNRPEVSTCGQLVETSFSAFWPFGIVRHFLKMSASRFLSIGGRSRRWPTEHSLSRGGSFSRMCLKMESTVVFWVFLAVLVGFVWFVAVASCVDGSQGFKLGSSPEFMVVSFVTW